MPEVIIDNSPAKPKNGWSCKWWGRPQCGLLRIRWHYGSDHKTFWHIAIWEFTFGMSFPGEIVNWITGESK